MTFSPSALGLQRERISSAFLLPFAFFIFCPSVLASINENEHATEEKKSSRTSASPTPASRHRSIEVHLAIGAQKTDEWMLIQSKTDCQSDPFPPSTSLSPPSLLLCVIQLRSFLPFSPPTLRLRRFFQHATAHTEKSSHKNLLSINFWVFFSFRFFAFF